MKLRGAALVLCLFLPAPVPAQADSDSVLGPSLDSFTQADPDFCAVTVKPPGSLWCEMLRSGSNGWLPPSIIPGSGGAPPFVLANERRVSLARDTALLEIEELSRKLGAKPTSVVWPPMPSGVQPMVIALWGRLALEDLNDVEVEEVAAGNTKGSDILIDTLGDRVQAAQRRLPLFRIVGSRGFVYSGALDDRGRGYRHYAAINATGATKARAAAALHAIILRDRPRARDDYSLWPEVATVVRRFALATSPNAAIDLMDEVFRAANSTKLYSRVWAVLPGGPIEHLGARQYWPVDIYAANTGNPRIRKEMQEVLRQYPSEHFSEFLHYALGDFEKVLQTNPTTPIKSVVDYIMARRALLPVLQDVMKMLKPSDLPARPDRKGDGVTEILAFLNGYPRLHSRRPLRNVLPDFAARVAPAEALLESVMGDATKSNSHADDAAYFLGWLAYHREDSARALSYFAKAMVTGNHDYDKFATMYAIRVLATYPPNDRLARIENEPAFAREPAIWYGAARASYRQLDFGAAIDLSQRALARLGVRVDRLPASTDPARILADLQRATGKENVDPNIAELPYLLQASREIIRFERSLASVEAEPEAALFARAKAIVVKYSRIVEDREPQPGQPAPIPILDHADYRQALYLLNVIIKAVPQEARYAKLRQWAHYRKVRILVGFAPREVSKAVAAMEAEFPRSSLLDDALAEQLVAEGIILKNLTAARVIFQKLKTQFRGANAIDNAHSWMALSLRCAGHTAEANVINRDIISNFRTTRHARYARERLQTPNATNCVYYGSEPDQEPLQ